VFFAALIDRRTWSELVYSLIGLPIGIAGFVFVVTSLSVSLGLSITLIGIPMLAVAISMARGLSGIYRGLGRGLLGISVDRPTVHRRRSGLLGYLTEPNAWRATLFLVVQFPVAIADFTIAVTLWSCAVGGITYPLWRNGLPIQRVHGIAHRGANLGPNYFLDSPPRIIGTVIVGLALLFITPWIMRGVLTVDRVLIRGLLGPTAASERIRSLEETRALAVDDSAASLRRIERDLHDGAQARLVSLAMSLGLAKEELDTSEDAEASLSRVRDLVDSAHREAKGTIVDLRDLARGIHPPALDNGLPDALSTLAARCAIPVTLRVELPERPSPAVETIVYFCTAELLTNIVKHSGAHHASIDVRTVDDRLFIRVGDDGAGGAGVARSGGSGLAGLADRVATVDGRLDIASPEGGPTLITIEIPI
jgi:signal transduction histidine kinase